MNDFWILGVLAVVVAGAIVLTRQFGEAMPQPDVAPHSTENSSPKPRVSRDDIKRAALDIVYPLPDCDKSWFGGTVEKCDAAQARLDQRRREYASFEPAWMRSAIMEWFDHAQRNIREAREDCLTQKSRKGMDEYDQRTKAERERANQVLRSIGR